jgi:uncharacterized protein with HEPN domain
LLTIEARKKYPNIPWKELAGLRDVTAHSYQTLRMDDTWKTATIEIPLIKIYIG